MRLLRRRAQALRVRVAGLQPCNRLVALALALEKFALQGFVLVAGLRLRLQQFCGMALGLQLRVLRVLRKAGGNVRVFGFALVELFAQGVAFTREQRDAFLQFGAFGL